MQVKNLLILIALTVPLHCASAASAIENAQGPLGLRITHAEVITAESGVTVDASISRSRLTRVLTPVQLQINLVKADGTIADTQTTVVSAADLVRRNSRDKHLKVVFADQVGNENYTVSIRWL
jgi:hypothetical protein